MTYPRAFAHIGLCVTNLERSIEFYRKVLGFYLVMGPAVIESDDSQMGRLCDDVFGKEFKKVRIVHMSTADGTGIELFQFIEPEVVKRENNFEYWKTGLFHFAVIDPDIEGLAKKIAENGGKQRSKVWAIFPDQPYKMVYCEDPDGNLLEIYTHGYEANFSNQGRY